jgi:hypothetical protein
MQNEISWPEGHSGQSRRSEVEVLRQATWPYGPAVAPSLQLSAFPSSQCGSRARCDSAGLRDDPKGWLFRTIGRGTGKLTRTVLPQANAYAMIRRRAAAAGIATKLGNHSFRATGITAYLKNGGTLEKAAAMANHASTRTTK